MRIYASDNDPIDFCKGCFPSEEEAIEEYGNIGNGPDDRGNCFDYDSYHPPYDAEYCCAGCGKTLGGRDEKR